MAAREIPNVGQRIRAIREAQGHSLRTLAGRSGLSVNAISLIERGENSPTVSSLHLLATALGVSITDFFKAAQEQSAVFVTPESRLRSQANGIAMESLGSGLHDQQLEPFLLRVGAGAGNLNQPVNHRGEEFVYCLDGEIDYCVGERIYRLEAGCSLLFAAGIPHCFHNATRSPALLILIFHAGNGHLARRLHLDVAAQGDGSETVEMAHSLQRR